MNPTHFLGIDPGHSGAIGCLNASGTTAQAWPMPTRRWNGNMEVDLAGLKDVLGRLRRLPQVVVGLEWPNTWKGQFGDVVHHAEVFGRCKGILEAMLFDLAFEYHRVAPNVWKAKLGLPGKSWDADSSQGVILWDATYPALGGVIRGPRGGILDGPLDALLIAHYLRLGNQSPVGWKGGKRPAVFRGVDLPS